MNNSLLIGLLIALVISMILYVQYHANNSVEQFADPTPSPNLNTKFLNCAYSQCQDSANLNNFSCENKKKVAYWSNPGGKFDSTKKCLSFNPNTPSDVNCSNNQYKAICGDPIVNNTDYLETNGLCKLEKPKKSMENINPDYFNSCKLDATNLKCPKELKTLPSGMYQENQNFIYTPCEDNYGNITNVIVTECYSDSQ